MTERMMISGAAVVTAALNESANEPLTIAPRQPAGSRSVSYHHAKTLVILDDKRE